MKIILFLILWLAFPHSTQAGILAPPKNKTLMIIGQDRDTIADYVRETGSMPGGVMFYTSVQKLDGLQLGIDYGSGYQDGQALLIYYPNSVLQIGLYMVGALDDISAGKYDKNINILADWIKKANRPVYLRIGYEFDNPLNNYDPQAYKTAFHYIVDFMRRLGVTNTAFVWHSFNNLKENPGRALMDWYPGDDYVDWFAVSIFSSNQIGQANKFLGLARQHKKPFMIAESSPFGMYSVRGKTDLFKHIFEFIKEQNVEAFSYINANWEDFSMYRGQNWGDARVQKDPEIKQMWLDKTSSERYLNASNDLFMLLGF